MTGFTDPTLITPSLNLQLGNPDKDLEYCLCRIRFVLPLFYSVVLVVIDYFTSKVLVLSEKRCEKRGTELV
jgi:hypothetical protein